MICIAGIFCSTHLPPRCLIKDKRVDEGICKLVNEFFLTFFQVYRLQQLSSNSQCHTRNNPYPRCRDPQYYGVAAARPHTVPLMPHLHVRILNSASLIVLGKTVEYRTSRDKKGSSASYSFFCLKLIEYSSLIINPHTTGQDRSTYHSFLARIMLIKIWRPFIYGTEQNWLSCNGSLF